MTDFLVYCIVYF